MPRLIGGPEKAHDADVTIVTHAYAWEPLCYLLHQIENFSGFQLQDKHNASYFSKMSWNGRDLSDGKFSENIWKREANLEDNTKEYFAEWKRLAIFAPKYLRNFGANKC